MVCEAPPLAEPVLYPGGVKIKPPFEMGVANLEETGTDRKIIIENQLEDTDHDHLGKLITYASGKGDDVIVWVVKHAREEHKAPVE